MHYMVWNAFAALLACSADDRFHSWCTEVGIETPLARLHTTPKSIAGRGVFATELIRKGEAAIIIPKDVVLYEKTGTRAFPKIARTVEKKKRRFENRHKWWNQVLGRNAGEFEFLRPSDFWQAELTAYSLASIETGHIWADWISQWQRDDPVQKLYANDVSWADGDALSTCVDELHEMLPDVSKYKLRAAVEIRLRRLDELKRVFGFRGANSISMHGILLSRAIDLGEGVTGLIPMFDMLNHSDQPNLAMSFDGSNFELLAVRDIENGEELFVSYRDTNGNDEWDEDSAVWALVQWGIPLRKTAAGAIPSYEQQKLQSSFALSH